MKALWNSERKRNQADKSINPVRSNQLDVCFVPCKIAKVSKENGYLSNIGFNIVLSLTLFQMGILHEKRIINHNMIKFHVRGDLGILA
jgi:hypothetical protein